MADWEFRDYQLSMARDAARVLRAYNIVYLTAEERVGKTGTAIALVGMVRPDTKVLILTKAVAVDDWTEQLSKFGADFEAEVLSYHSAHKASGEHTLVILDESHNYISASPKVGTMWRKVAVHTRGRPIIYISATPHAQGYHQLYHQFKLSKWSPWKDYRDFYAWYRHYALRDEAGNTETKWLNGKLRETYTCLRDAEVNDSCKHLFITKTRRALGFNYEPQDKVHEIELAPNTKQAMRNLQNRRVLKFGFHGESLTYVADTVSKLRIGLHQLEGGTLIVHSEDDERASRSLVLGERSKIDYILKEFGDTSDLAIMYNFKAEETKLREVFKNALVLQATRYAEGVELSDVEHLVVYSQDYSTARHSQRRARQASKDRKSPIIVHHLLVKDGVSAQVYQVVCINKQNYIDSRFKLLPL